ncbi:UrcA family protein [Novosphingobium sp. M1R2S20]|uniref:UrcA family protein n=1 Tax=Novosphingobium rhizovicinum TaxID=3228928 RepID=A0ABV3RA39_9SPHN
MMKTALFAAAAALATVATAAPAMAKDVPVRHGDLDLTSAKDQKTLARRIDRAARKACDVQYGRLPSADVMNCYQEAHTAGRTQMASVIDDARLGG